MKACILNYFSQTTSPIPSGEYNLDCSTLFISQMSKNLWFPG